jgi:light-regulated signal transduction histidine kinase (bacteriophytochrome)
MMTQQTVDLTSCDREPIHIPGRIQPFGFLLVTTTDFIVTAASSNAGEFLGSGDLIGRHLNELFDAGPLQQLRDRLSSAQAPTR